MQGEGGGGGGGGGLYTGCNDFSRNYALPPGLVKHELIVGGPSARRRDAPDTTGWLTSFSVEERGSRVLPQSSWCVHR